LSDPNKANSVPELGGLALSDRRW